MNHLAKTCLLVSSVVVAIGLPPVNALPRPSQVEQELELGKPGNGSMAVDEEIEFEPPLRLMAGGKPIEVEAPGYACPTLADLEGQGALDLIVGQFANGNMLRFRNAAQAGETPRYGTGEWLMTGHDRASVPGIRCCTSSTPQLIDWNQDGRLDVLSGCYATPGSPAGHILMLIGEPEFRFSRAVYLSGSNNQRLENADFSFPGFDPQRTQDSICTHQHAADLDQDGDPDLIVGSSGGKFFYYRNDGSLHTPKLKQPPIPLSVSSPVARSAPHLVDWNGDGLLDLLTGGSEGGVYLSLNRGPLENPGWAEFTVLIPPTHRPKQLANATIVPGHSWRLWVTDWNFDGQLDVLVGDAVSLLSARPDVPEALFAEKERELGIRSNELAKLQSRLQEVNQHSSSPDRVVQRAELEQALGRCVAEIQRMEANRFQWAAERKTGFVWLFLRK